jgi:hypothetical protein
MRISLLFFMYSSSLLASVVPVEGPGLVNAVLENRFFHPTVCAFFLGATYCVNQTKIGNHYEIPKQRVSIDKKKKVEDQQNSSNRTKNFLKQTFLYTSLEYCSAFIASASQGPVDQAASSAFSLICYNPLFYKGLFTDYRRRAFLPKQRSLFQCQSGFGELLLKTVISKVSLIEGTSDAAKIYYTHWLGADDFVAVPYQSDPAYLLSRIVPWVGSWKRLPENIRCNKSHTKALNFIGDCSYVGGKIASLCIPGYLPMQTWQVSLFGHMLSLFFLNKFNHLLDDDKEVILEKKVPRLSRRHSSVGFSSKKEVTGQEKPQLVRSNSSIFAASKNGKIVLEKIERKELIAACLTRMKAREKAPNTFFRRLVTFISSSPNLKIIVKNGLFIGIAFLTHLISYKICRGYATLISRWSNRAVRVP